MTYGSVDSKIDRLQPVIERTRFVHGRISSPGAIQIPIRGGGQANHEAVFRKVWTRSFAAFAKSAAPGDYFCFYPELLSPSYFYARVNGGLEETDRWLEALHLAKIAKDCWAAATSSGNPA